MISNTLIYFLLFQFFVLSFYLVYFSSGYLGCLFMIMVSYEFILLFWLTGFSKFYYNSMLSFFMVILMYFYFLFVNDWFILTQLFGIEVFIFFIVLELFLFLII